MADLPHIATQFSVLRSLCYPDSPLTNHKWTPDPFNASTRKHAETNGHRLTKIDEDFFDETDTESAFVTLLHEVTHHNDGTSWGKGNSSHPPSFWNEYATNFNKLLNNDPHSNVVESVFEPKFSWHRARYRAIQNVYQVDKRSETVDERKEQLAKDIGYNNYDKFENGDWGLTHLAIDPRYSDISHLQTNIFIPDQRFSDEFTDETLLKFIDENDGKVPLPIVSLSINDYRNSGPQIIKDAQKWDRSPLNRNDRLALAVQERIGMGYNGAVKSLIKERDQIPFKTTSM